MNETMTLEEAARLVARAERWDDALARRTEGLSWMIWALVAPGILVTNAWLNATAPSYWAWGAWIPWVLLGTLACYGLWRTAALTRPDLERPSLAGYVTRFVVVIALLLLLNFVVKPNTMAFPLALIGVGYIAISIFSRRLTREGRNVGAAIGATITLAGVIVGILAVDAGPSTLAGALVLGLVPAAGGLYQTLRA